MDINDLLSLHPSDEIELRIVNENDATTYYGVIDKNRSRLKQWLGWLDRTNSVEDIKSFIQVGLDGFKAKKVFRFGIYFSGEFSGIIELQSVDYINRMSEIGYWLADGYEGKGIMSQSVIALMDFAFNTLNLNKIVLEIATKNLKSNKLANRIGFKKDGVLRQNYWLYDHFVDHNVYSMLKDEWMSRVK